MLFLYEQFKFFFRFVAQSEMVENWFKVTCSSNWWVRYIGVHFYVLCEEPGPNLNPSTPSTSHSLDSGASILPDSLCLLLSLASYRFSCGLVAGSEDSQLVLRSIVLKRLLRHPPLPAGITLINIERKKNKTKRQDPKHLFTLFSSQIF